jgi:cytochrome c oxidase subunit IV
MTDDGHVREGHGAHSTHILPIRVYFIVFGLLLVLLLITVEASYIHLGALLNNGLALTIAIVKATLVVLYFMHVKFSSRLTWLWAAAGFVWLILMFTILGDYFTRGWAPVRGW